jgi:hypothetical protein
MKNYFETSQVNWSNFSPKDIIFKRNKITKALLPEENTMSWSSKQSRNYEVSKNAGGQPVKMGNHTYYTNDGLVGVFVQLTNLNTPFPDANIDILDYRPKTNSIGHKLNRMDILMYVRSNHAHWQWKQDTQGNYVRDYDPNTAPLEEGYRIAYGGQGEDNAMPFELFTEVLQIANAVKSFLIDRVVPFKNKEIIVNDYGMAEMIEKESIPELV